MKIRNYVQEFLNSAVAEDGWLRKERFVCRDGKVFSIQASEVHYSTPRVNNASVYEKVEVLSVGNEVEPMLEDYVDSEEENYVVYSYVPVDPMNKVIQSHKGRSSLSFKACKRGE